MYFGKKITAALKVALYGFIRDSFDLFRSMVFDETFSFFYNCKSRRLLGTVRCILERTRRPQKMLKCDSGAPTGGGGEAPHSLDKI